MDPNNNQNSRPQSSLPTSLIPHLYNAPQPQNIPPARTHYPRLWREGEPGPSSLLPPSPQPQPRYHSTYSQYESYERHQPSTYSRSQYTPLHQSHLYGQTQSLTHSTTQSQSHNQSQSQHQFDNVQYPPAERTRYRERSEPYSPIQYSYENVLPPAQQLFDSYERESYDRHSYQPPQNMNMSMSAPSASTSAPHTDTPVYYDSHYPPRATSLSRSLDYEYDHDQDQDQDNEYDRDRDPDTYTSTSHDSKRPRAGSLSTDDGARKSKKTAVACNFCRGRKLRCNGAKPTCQNCAVRKFECEYVPVQRRRGPGKKNGSRSKKTHPSSASSSSAAANKNTSDRPVSAVPDYDLDTVAPELRPHMSVMALDNYGFQPPSPTPSYPPPPPAPLHSHSQAQDIRYMDTSGREYYSPAPESHFRTRETSAEDRSGAQSLYNRNMR